jgi:hypothetical protein
VRLDDDIANVQSRAERDPFFWRLIGFAAVHASLDCDSAFESVANAFETGNEAITSVFNDLPAGRGDRRLDDLPEEGHQTRVGIGLILVHQPRVARDVREENCGKPALHSRTTEVATELGRLACSSKASSRG